MPPKLAISLKHELDLQSIFQQRRTSKRQRQEELPAGRESRPLPRRLHDLRRIHLQRHPDGRTAVAERAQTQVGVAVGDSFQRSGRRFGGPSTSFHKYTLAKNLGDVVLDVFFPKFERGGAIFGLLFQFFYRKLS